MMEKAAKEFDELCRIADLDLRVAIACNNFSNGEISAKAIRMLYDMLDSERKINLIEQVYSEEVREENIKRLPPKILVPEAVRVKNANDYKLFSTLLKFHLISEYETSKTQNKFFKLKKILNKFINNPIVDFSFAKNMHTSRYAIYGEAIYGFLHEKMKQNKEMNTNSLGLPTNATIGMEIEFVGVYEEDLLEITELLKEYDIDMLGQFEVDYDGSVYEHDKYQTPGIELKSPIMKDSEKDWKELKKVCGFIQLYGGKANSTCGGHIHFGKNILGVDEKAWDTLKDLWIKAEDIIYTISNRKGEITRKRASSYAQKTTTQLLCLLDYGFYQINSEEDVRKLAGRISEGNRYFGLNLANIANPYSSKDTIEFRVSNGSVDYNIWRENALLYGKILQFAKLNSVMPEIKANEFKEFNKRNLSEEERLCRFLDLIFDKEEEKSIFYKRWEALKGPIPDEVKKKRTNKTNETR